MPELSLYHIDQISCDIRREEITFSHLREDLIDHVCCDVEYEMQKGLTFSDAYSAVKKKMGTHRPKEIQKETLYAVDTKYRYMKNTMKISGITGTLLLGFAAFFKIQHWPMAGPMLVIGAFLLAFVFMPSALTVLWKETHNGKRIFLYIAAFISAMLFITGIVFKVQHWPLAGTIITLSAVFGVLFFIPTLLISKLSYEPNASKRQIYILGSAGLIFYILGLLFKIQHWPLATLLMMAGLAIIFLVVFPWYTWISWKDETSVSIRFIFMLIASVAIVVPSALVTLNLQRSYELGFYNPQLEVQELFKSEFRNNLALLKTRTDSASSPLPQQIHSKTNDLLAVINNIEAKMINESSKSHQTQEAQTQEIIRTEYGPLIQFNQLINPFNARPVMDFLMSSTTTRMELDAALKAYSDYLSGLTKGANPGSFSKLLDASVYLHEENISEGKVSLLSGLHSLALLKNSILAVESNALSAASKL
jgi:hypothetical protein